MTTTGLGHVVTTLYTKTFGKKYSKEEFDKFIEQLKAKLNS